MMFAVSCMDMYNDLADELGADYNYFLAVAQRKSNGQLFMYSINSSGARIDQVWSSSVTLDTRNPYYIEVDPTGNYLYVPYFNVNWVGVYKINNDGSLAFVDSQGASAPWMVKVHPSGKYVYYSNSSNSTISMYGVNSDGKLTSLGAPVASFGATPTKLAIDTTGAYLFVVNTGAGNLSVFDINSDGTLTHKNNCASAGIRDVIVDMNNHVYISSNVGIYLYNISSNTILIQDSVGSSGYLETHPSGEFLYWVAAISAGYNSYRINSNGTLVYITNSGSTTSVMDMVVDPTGKYLYSSHFDLTGYLRINAINSDGTIGSQVQQISSDSLTGLALIKQKK